MDNYNISSSSIILVSPRPCRSYFHVFVRSSPNLSRLTFNYMHEYFLNLQAFSSYNFFVIFINVLMFIYQLFTMTYANNSKMYEQGRLLSAILCRFNETAITAFWSAYNTENTWNGPIEHFICGRYRIKFEERIEDAHSIKTEMPWLDCIKHSFRVTIIKVLKVKDNYSLEYCTIKISSLAQHIVAHHRRCTHKVLSIYVYTMHACYNSLEPIHGFLYLRLSRGHGPGTLNTYI